jgi:hypothetical protein
MAQPKEPPEQGGFHRLMMSWPVYAPPLALTLILCPPLLPILVKDPDQPWWMVTAFLSGPLTLTLLAILVPLFRPSLLFGEKNRLTYLAKHSITGKKFEAPKPRSRKLTKKPDA